MSVCPVKTYNPICSRQNAGWRLTNTYASKPKEKWEKGANTGGVNYSAGKVGGELDRWRAERTQQLRSPPVLRAS